jgi:hypothetical protein
MTAVAPPRQRWNTGLYLRIQSTRYESGILQIRFADGEEVAVPVDHLDSIQLVSPDWSAVTSGPLWITVPTAHGDIEISWLTIRLLTDPEFRAYWEVRSQDDA